MNTMNKTKMTSAIFTAFLVLAVFAVIAPYAVGTNGGSDLFDELQPLVDVYNDNVGDIPLITSMIGEERINGEILLNDGSVLNIAIMTDKDAKITSFEKGEISDPTMSASTDEDTIRSIITSSDPVSAFIDALNAGTITYESDSALQDFGLQIALWIAGWIM
jgi:hypothetical protein